MIRLTWESEDNDDKGEYWINGKDVESIGHNTFHKKNSTIVETYQGKKYRTNMSQARVAELVTMELHE